MGEIKIAPSILSANFAHMGDAVKKLEKNGADIVHCDVMDGVFVPNITFGLKMIEDIRKETSLPLDCHLMMTDPYPYIERFIRAGATDITVHFEACRERTGDVIRAIKENGCKCGVVLNPDTPLSAIYNTAELCDMILLMSVYPGFGGQTFMPHVLDKLRQTRKLIDSIGKDIDLEVDGGVTNENVRQIKEAGANVIVAGSAVFNAPDMKEAIARLRNN